ncbi:hypothetical protein AURDEDRAFT_117956 [Auricularia subglabra TFB-10046 SS5]|uniref:Uncharacterized protein n=1 Tax=Auricularia subglabra (strain TFB-10046 / SS5) TaxID=717982 RepID=J0D2N1_AURST|nr:hypothetical protein AURDEDRAFT_117956 [Auricularia subglabra TFB-10046 SS5]
MMLCQDEEARAQVGLASYTARTAPLRCSQVPTPTRRRGAARLPNSSVEAERASAVFD